MTDQDLIQLRRLFEVMEQLRAPGGCPWDRVQTHQTLMPYLLEETYEAIQAAEEGIPGELAEELGDLLVEVAMQVAIATEEGAFDVGTVARVASEKMIGRHPHVFGDAKVDGVDQVLANWEELKQREKPERQSALDGIPKSLPALALASAIQRRQGAADADDQVEPGTAATEALRRLVAGTGGPGKDQELVGDLLYAVVALARDRGVDPEGALRRHASGRRQALRTAHLAGGAERGSAVPAEPAERGN